MSSDASYRLSLHISHPTSSAAEIVRAVGLPVRYKNSVGEKRLTRYGREIGGLYKRTDVSFLVGNGVTKVDDVTPNELVSHAMAQVPLEVFTQISLSGGSSFFLLGVYAEINAVIPLDSSLLLLLGKYEIGLKFDFYGGSEQAAG